MSQQTIEQQPIELPPRMKATLEQYRNRVWTVKLAEGALAAVFGLVISFLAVFALDRLFDTPASLRALCLLAGSVGMVILFPLKYHNWVWSHRRLDQVARLVRHKFPRFGDHLLGIVELAQNEAEQISSRRLVEAAIKQIDKELEERDLSDAVPNPLHLHWAWAAGIPLVITAVVMVSIPAAGGNALVRWLMPWRDVERYTFAQLDGESELRVVPHAEPFAVEVSLKEESAWKPAAGTARFGRQEKVVAELDGETYRFQMPPQTSDGSITLNVGDSQRTIPVEAKMRPALKQLVAEVQLPAYLQRSEGLIEDARGGTVSLVKGSSAVFKANATRELAQATLNGRQQFVDGSQLTTEKIRVETTGQYQLLWRDLYGLDASGPQLLNVEALEDEAPSAGFNQLKNNQVILSTQLLAFEVQTSDDFGVKTVGLEWQGILDPVHNPQPTNGEKIVAAGDPSTDSMTVAATFSAEREGVRAQSLRLRVFAEDYYPTRERSYSPYLVLHVLTPEDHYKWVTEQMALWAGAAQEVHDKELQLHETNRELRDLSPEALDDPAQRKKIQNQAVAEAANAARLDSLVEMGKELVTEALKNEEFDPDQLDTWAEIIKQLEEIANLKMPSVADLLAAAAEAQGKPSEAPPEATPPGKPPQGKPQEGEPEKGPMAPPGGTPNDLEKAEKYGPDSKKPTDGLDEFPDDPNKPGGEVNVDRSKPAEGKPGYLPANPVPLVLDHESGFNKSEKAGDAPQIVGGLGLPKTLLKGSGNEEDPNAPAPQTVELVIEAFEVQQELLDAFAKVAEEMNKLLMGFENSTFVKRLKAASRRQIDIAAELNSLDGFGQVSVEEDNQPALNGLAEREVAESDTVLLLQEDMAAYADRRPSANYTRALDEMQKEDVSRQLGAISPAIKKNQVGQSTIEAEFWADALDRWAEQLVDPLPPGGGPPPAGPIILPNLPPEIIVQVLRIINDEIDLREETRELGQAEKALPLVFFQAGGDALQKDQIELAKQTLDVVKQIEELPNGDEFGKEIKKLNDASTVMDEVQGVLGTPIADSTTIAAISEVIEILLETGRVPNAPMVVKTAPSSVPALMLMGQGDDVGKAYIKDRAVGQVTGSAGRNLPDEFRQGLDAYFDALEGKTHQ